MQGFFYMVTSLIKDNLVYSNRQKYVFLNSSSIKRARRLQEAFTRSVLRGGGGEGEGRAREGGSRHEFTNNNFAFHDSQNQYLRFYDS